MPKISVIICTYNRDSLLERAVSSVLSQSFKDLELVIVDDGSIDDTQSVLARLAESDRRIVCVRNEKNLGISASRNRGAKTARGEYLAMLDSDDYWLDKEKLRKQAALLDKREEIALIGTAIVLVDENGTKIGEDIYEVEDEQIRLKMLSKNQFCQSSVMFRKSVFMEVGGYDERFSVCEDYDLWLRMGERYKLANLVDIGIAYLVHPAGISKKRRLEIIKASDDLVEKHKNYYPGYIQAKLRSLARFARLLVMRK